MNRQHGSVVTATISGREVRFFVEDERDVIQQYHAVGQFYEVEELRIIEEFFPRGGVFVDIGSNVGNHSLYVGTYLHPRQIILFEPNPPAIAILTLNLALNGLQPVADLTYLGTGLADVPSRAQARVPEGNLGGTWLAPTQEEDALVLIRGDDALAHRRVDFLKIDVEGMEMQVLAGLQRTIATWRPPLFIEIENRNAEAFQSWTERQGYRIERRFRRYEANENYLALPIEA
ncbi:FkbM family methyltransferase [Belnapia sp. T18]|uniref:FkbM family methyltransferase n=1 Tax=Belnapia arida TaxID=2804533 RepID=A0ABS1U628_9PROT|nr:FkbM family methyltransferase [Belnapia arida]MBL6080129.1 FkbM family methyltransferase [Belnapia arida]